MRGLVPIVIPSSGGGCSPSGALVANREGSLDGVRNALRAFRGGAWARAPPAATSGFRMPRMALESGPSSVLGRCWAG